MGTPSINTTALASDFIDATVNKYGTDEDVVCSILKKVHDAGSDAAGDFEVRVFELLTDDQRDYFAENYGQQNVGQRLIPSILQDECELTSELYKAEDMWQYGTERFRADTSSYFLEGAASIADFSSTGSKVGLVAGVVLMGGVALVCAPATAAVIGSAVVIGFATYAGGKIIKNGVELGTSDSDAEFKNNMRDMGEGVAIAATTVPFVPKGVKTLNGAVEALQAARLVRAMEGTFTEHVLLPVLNDIINRGLAGEMGVFLQAFLKALTPDQRLVWVDQYCLKYYGNGKFEFNPAEIINKMFTTQPRGMGDYHRALNAGYNALFPNGTQYPMNVAEKQLLQHEIFGMARVVAAPLDSVPLAVVRYFNTALRPDLYTLKLRGYFVPEGFSRQVGGTRGGPTNAEMDAADEAIRRLRVDRSVQLDPEKVRLTILGDEGDPNAPWLLSLDE